MNAYHWNSIAWDTSLTLDTNYERVCTDPGLQSLRVTGMTTFSPFAMSSGGSGPTAVSLQSFTVENNTIPVLVITTLLVLLLGTTAFIWQHKRH